MAKAPPAAGMTQTSPRVLPRSVVHLVSLAIFASGILCTPCAAQVDDAFVLLNSIAIDGGYDLGDQARGVSIDGGGNIFLAGYVTVPGQGRDIFLARFNKDLVMQDSVTVNGPANGDDEGYVMAFDGAGFLYLVGYLTE